MQLQKISFKYEQKEWLIVLQYCIGFPMSGDDILLMTYSLPHAYQFFKSLPTKTYAHKNLRKRQ